MLHCCSFSHTFCKSNSLASKMVTYLGRALCLIASILLATSSNVVECYTVNPQLTALTRDAKPTTVHVIVSNHLDIGFHSNSDEPGSDKAVFNQYFDNYFPRAVSLAKELREENNTDVLRYMTHSYLVSLYLDCPDRMEIHCPSPQQQEDFRQALKAGDIFYHAFPHNAQLELFDPDLLQYAVQLTHDLDKELGLPTKMTMSQRDVPGLTRAAIPILVNAGIKALSVGVNGGSAPPAVPRNTPFRWRDPTSNTELIAFWHAGAYSDYVIGSTGPTLDREPCVRLAGFNHILCTAWKGDNEGPPTKDELIQVFDRIREDFPDAQVVASTFDEYVTELLDALESNRLVTELEVVEEEIGDTWIFGIASDPARVAAYKALLRTRRSLLSRDSKEEAWTNTTMNAFSRMLIKIPEHTWGVDSKQDPGDFENWSNTRFHQKLKDQDEHFMNAVESWTRQRQYLQWAIDELAGGDTIGSSNDYIIDALEAELANMHTVPNPAEYEEDLTSIARTTDAIVYHSHAWQLEFDRDTGTIIGLAYHKNSTNANQPHWQSADSPLAQVVYSTYSEDDYDVIWKEYAYQPHIPDWFLKDFGKPNATKLGGAERRDAVPHLVNIWHNRTSGGGLKVLVKSQFDSKLVNDAGAPKNIWLEINSPPDSEDLFIDVVWHDKTPTRLPESLWVRWIPEVASVDVDSWVMHKLGQPISPYGIIKNGSHSLHAVGDEGVSVDLVTRENSSCSSKLHIRSLDAPLVSPGKPNIFPQVEGDPDMTGGMSFSLVNNMWGTNYIMWYPYHEVDGTMRFRFVLRVETECEGVVAAVV